MTAAVQLTDESAAVAVDRLRIELRSRGRPTELVHDVSFTLRRGERLALGVPSFAALNIVLTGLWLGVVAMLNVSLARKAALNPPSASAAAHGHA